MNQNTKTSNLIKTIVIICDFLVLNILLYAYVRWNWAVHDFTNGTRGMILAVLANFGMVFAQFFFLHSCPWTSYHIRTDSQTGYFAGFVAWCDDVLDIKCFLSA